MSPFVSILSKNTNFYHENLSLNSPTVGRKQIKLEANASHLAKPQTCNICGRVLSSSSSYYVHMKMHSDHKPFQCPSCEVAFCRKPYLEAHMRTHTGEKPFKCTYCDKRFTQKSSLNTHKRVHTGERPYSCDLCNKRFTVKSYVTAHRWTHIGEKPLSCSYCDLSFTSKHQFAIHIKTHSAAGQNFNCSICSRTFSREAYLIRHQNRVHKINGKRRISVDSDVIFINPDF